MAAANFRPTAAAAPSRRVKVFVDDLVLRRHADGVGADLGVVQRTYDEDDVFDDEDAHHPEAQLRLNPGDVRVIFYGSGPFHPMTTVNENELTVLDHALGYGDVVGVAPGVVIPGLSDANATGVVMGMRVVADLVPLVELQKLTLANRNDFTQALLSNMQVRHLTRNVDTRRLSPTLNKYLEGELVSNGTWFGAVVETRESVMVLFMDGALCEVNAEDSDLLEPYQGPMVTVDALVPGLIVVGPPDVWARAKWIRGAYMHARTGGIIADVIAGHVTAKWKFRPDGPAENDPFSPSPLLDEPDLNITANMFKPLETACGDLVVVVKNEDGSDNGLHATAFGIARGTSPAFLTAPDTVVPHVSLLEAARAMRQFWANPTNLNTAATMDFSYVQVVVKTTTYADVRWRDGTVSQNIMAKDLLPLIAMDDYDFWPGMVVSRRGADKTNDYSYGVVQSANTTERLVDVQWYHKQDESSRFEPQGGVDRASAYELNIHSSWGLDAKAIVLRTAVPSIEPTPAQIHDAEQVLGRLYMGALPPLVTFTNANMYNKPWFGTVIHMLVDGLFVIVWDDGTYSLLRPDAIVPVASEDEQPADNADGDDNDWVTDDEEAAPPPATRHGHDHSQSEHAGGEDDDDMWESVSEGDDSGGDEPEEDDASAKYSSSFAESGASPPRTSQPMMNTTPTVSTTVPAPPVTSQPATENSTIGYAACRLLTPYEQLESAPTDHHFSSSTGARDKSRLRRIMQELQTLATSLPQGIFVRSYEDSTDLMRALIVGPPGTPYQDVLFWFDIAMPAAYPNEPPKCYFYSLTDGMGRINPNLYEDGKVCLSLLNTWVGDATESWTKDSSLLQLLISIQGLVLVKYPYFNEAGYEKQRGTVEALSNAIVYNERAFMLSMKTVINTLRRPPAGFEADVRKFYIDGNVLPALIARCEHLVNNAGSQADDGSVIYGEEPVVVNVSPGCRRILESFITQMRALLA